jgi:protein-S-isoprenylcysteine O-methyltransferase Ste14
MGIARQLAAVALLPVTVALVIPALIAWRTGPDGGGAALSVAGGPLVAAGIALVAWTATLFGRVGRGTIAPWDPTRRLVVVGPYRHVRNPMISGVLAILLGEVVLLGSLPLLLWFAAVLAVNAVYLPLVEEPGLRKRFGADYDAYRANVPRWIPRLRPWEPRSGLS